MTTACVAAVIYGGWAFFANHAHGTSIALRVMLAQGAASFALTFVTTIVIEALLARLGRRWPGVVQTIVYAFAGCQVVIVLMHLAVGTPEILRTMAPSLIIGATFTTVYTVGLSRLTPDVAGPAP